MPKFNRFQGSPDVFDESGKYYNQESLTAAGVSDPASISELETTRPDVVNETDFARLSGTNIGGQGVPGQISQSPQGTVAPSSGLINPTTNQLAEKPSPFKVGFQQATQSGVNEVSSASDARTMVNQYVTPPADSSKSIEFLQNDPFFDGLVKTFQDYINPANQRKSLKDTYQTMLKDTGIQDLDMDLINTKNIIEGSEEDIRNEIIKSGGWASNSQVLALTNARNKQLVKNYNTLLETRNSKEKYLNTMIGLEKDDREAADAHFEQSMDLAFQISDYKQKMQTNAIASLDRAQKAMGWEGILNATQGDPYTMRLIEKTYGLPQGGLAQAAEKEMIARQQEEYKLALDVETKESQLATDEYQRANIDSQIQERNAMAPLERQLKEEQVKSEGVDRSLKAEQIKTEQVDRALRAEQVKTEKAQQAKIYSDIKNATTEKQNKPLTEGQSKALGYGSRLVQSGSIIDKIGDNFSKVPATSFKIFGKEIVPGFLKGADQKQFEQAKRNFINATLRRESGAAISNDEFSNADQQYFPKFGDDKKTLVQKSENRRLTTSNLLSEGGMGFIDPRTLSVSPTGELIQITK